MRTDNIVLKTTPIAYTARSSVRGESLIKQCEVVVLHWSFDAFDYSGFDFEPDEFG
jgi:hypothetical protein